MLAVADRGTAQAGRAGVHEWPGQRARAHTYVGGLTTEKFYFHKTPLSLSMNTGNSYQVWWELSDRRSPGLVYSIENTAIY